jgi:hypothetical protein
MEKDSTNELSSKNTAQKLVQYSPWMNAKNRWCTFRRRRLVLKTAAGRRRELHSSPTTRRPIRNAFQERAKWRGEARENRSKGPSLYAESRALAVRIEQPGNATTSSAEPAEPPRSVPAACRREGAIFSIRELKFTSRQRASRSKNTCFNSGKASELAGDGTAMLKAAAFAAPAAPGGTPAQRNLLPRDWAQISPPRAREWQLRAPGDPPPLNRRSDRRRRRGQQLGAEHPAAATVSCLLLSRLQPPSCFASRLFLASLLALAAASPPSSSCCLLLECARLLGVLSFNPTSGAPPFRYSSSSLPLLPCFKQDFLSLHASGKFLHLFFYSPWACTIVHIVHGMVWHGFLARFLYS